MAKACHLHLFMIYVKKELIWGFFLQDTDTTGEESTDIPAEEILGDARPLPSLGQTHLFTSRPWTGWTPTVQAGVLTS